MDKKEEKEVEYLNSHINRLWTSMIVLIGGLSGLALSLSGNDFIYKTIFKVFLLILGFCFLPIIINGLMNSDNRINNKLK